MGQVLGFSREKRNWRRKKEGRESDSWKEEAKFRAEGNQGQLPGGGSTSQVHSAQRRTGVSWDAERLTHEACGAASPKGPVPRLCVVCRRNHAIGWLPWEGSNSVGVHSRLKDIVGFGALETGKQACHSHPFLQSLFPPRIVPCHLPLGEASIKKSAPQQRTLLSGAPRNPPAGCPHPQQYTHSFWSSCSTSWSEPVGKSREDESGNSRPWRACLNTGTIWGSSFIFSLKSVHPPVLYYRSSSLGLQQ